MLRNVLALLALAAIATPALSADKTPYRMPKGSDAIACTGTPFGKRLALGIDHEVLVTRRQVGGTGTLVNYQFTGDLASQQRQAALTGDFASNFDFKSTRVDLDGNGRQELATAAIRASGVVSVTVVRPAAAANANEQTTAWSVGPPTTGVTVTAIDLAAGDLDGSTDGKEELVLAARYSNGNVRIFALSGDANGAITQAPGASLGNWTMPTAESSETTELVIAVGDVLLEGRDQVVLLTLFRQGNYRYSVLRFEDVDSPGGPGTRFNHRNFTQSRPGSSSPVGRLQMHIGDLGGSAADELVIHDHPIEIAGQNLQNINQSLRYFSTTRGTNNTITDYALQPSSGLVNVISSTDNRFAAAMGEIDRRPDLEVVVARSVGGEQVTRAVRVDVYKATFNASGFPVAIGPAAGFASATTGLETDQPQQIEVAIGDADRDAIGDIYVAFRDNAAGGGAIITKLRRFALARPANPNAFPNGATLAQTGQFNFPTNFADTTAIQVQANDWDNDSLLANLGTTCRQIREPVVRNVLRLPPYWSRLQSGLNGFNAAIGSSRTDGTGLESRYDTFTSHDVSGYVGVQAGGEILGIGAQVTAKVTAGYNYETRRGELRGSEETTTVGQSQEQDSGGGLVVIEENTFNCYDYEVLRNGAEVIDSNVRACEIVRANSSGDLLRSFIASDLETWDTTTAGSAGPGGTPRQWVPLHQEWANLALFRVALPNTFLGTAARPLATDGLVATVLGSSSASTFPYFDIDLGSVQDITNIRVFPDPLNKAALAGATVFLSESPFAGATPPVGPEVRTYNPDSVSDNGVDRWNVWTRATTAPYAPVRARYIRVQHTSPNPRILRVAELQVFGDVHAEPPTYPVAVCDTTPFDGLFRARVIDTVNTPRAYRNIDVRGDLIWSASPVDAQCGTNHSRVKLLSIWNNIAIGGVSGTGVNTWTFDNETLDTQVNTTSISHSTRVGAEVEAEAGAIVQAVVGGAYEWATGVTEENSTKIYWGSGINYAGAVPGFSGVSTTLCQYRPQPFAYEAGERSNIGFEHRFKVIDYVVRTPGADWLLNPPPAACFPETPPAPDPVFSSGFEP